MPTDDDYGRRERLLLHQFPSAQYGQSTASPLPSSSSGNSASSSVSQVGPVNTIDCYHKQQPEYRSLSSAASSCAPDCGYVGSSEQAEKCADEKAKCGESRGIQVGCDRFSVAASQERFSLQSSSAIHHQYVSGRPICQTIPQTLAASDHYPRYGEHVDEQQQHQQQRSTQSELATSTSEYANACVLVSSASDGMFSSDNFPSPPSPAPANDRFVPPPPLSPSPSEKYASSQSLAGYPVADRILPGGSPNARDRFGTAPTSPIPPASKDVRFSSSVERLLVSATGIHDQKEQQQRYASSTSTERLLSTTSPVLGNLQGDRCGKDSVARYTALSSDRLLSSSPVHASVPERFANKPQSYDGFLVESPVRDRYQSHTRYTSVATSTERFLSSSPNPEGAHQRYSSSERILAPSAVTVSTAEQTRRYAGTANDRPSSTPAVAEFSARFTGFQDTVTARYVADRFNDLGLQRFAGQPRSGERFLANERYLGNSAGGQQHGDGRTVSNETARYSSGSSTERLLASSSPSSSETSRYHSPYTNTGGTQSAADRYDALSPTTENGHRGYTQSLSKSSDKYMQLSKSMQSYGNDRYQLSSNQADQFDRPGQDRYGVERFSNGCNNGNDRFQSSGNERFHGAADRYSPARTGADKYLSLPKPKDRYPTGRVVSSCSSISTGSSDRNYGSGSGSYVLPTAHTPVERYVPQPPPEVLYPDRYVDRYVPPGAHTPSDRYVPAADSGDPYVRRDLGFHHHYRLPPPGYPYHQSHFRFRGFAYAAPVRISGSPGSSSSGSSTSAQRDGLSTSPLLRPKVRGASAIEFTANASRHVCGNSCCGETASGQRGCCQQIRRSLPPGALSAIPTQSAHSSWQPSPGSGTTGTSTISTSCTDGDSGSQTIGMYPLEARAGPTTSTSSSAQPVDPTARGIVGTAMNISRSLSAPAGPRPVMPTVSSASVSDITVPRPKLRRNYSRTEAIKNYIKRETATFFGVDEETEAIEKQRWLDRRRRMASRKYGVLLPEHRPPDPDITKDVPDAMEMPESVTLRKWQRRVRRKDSVARMTLSGLHYMVETLTRRRSRGRSDTHPESRSFPPSVITSVCPTDIGTLTDSGVEEEEAFFQRPPPLSSPLPTSPEQPQMQLEQTPVTTTENEAPPGTSADIETAAGAIRESTEEVVSGYVQQSDDVSTIDGQNRRPRSIIRDHYTLRSRLDTQIPEEVATEVQSVEKVTMRKNIGGKRISSSTIDRVFDNSNRRQYGMGIVGRYFGRSFRKSVAQKPDVRKQLDDIEDHRPYFTYWITTVQILILIISLACYGFGPIGFNLHHKSGSVLVTSLSLQQVDFQEPANFWIGPRAADLIHLGAKFAPCMRRDLKILKEIDVWRERERDTACCIRNDDSGCVQSSKADCSNTISTWKKWGPGDSGPGGRISGSVCGLDPKFCDAPASVAPYEWPDDITKWPICRKTNPFSQRFRSKDSNQHGNGNFPIGRYKDKMAEHMVCEVIGHPCCIGIHGMCRITTKEYCDFVHGYFHEEASLCSQVECLHDVCGMIPFLHPEWPDQFYRLFTTIFLHAGILHLIITLLVQYFLMRDLEKLTGSLRIALIYFIGALAGNLASAIFVPYRAEVGPAGAHFALLATLVVEVLHCWPMLKYPRRALMKLISILAILLAIGVLPWVDNYAHLFGFVFGFLAAYALMPFISFGHYDRRRKIFLIWVSLILIVGLFTLLLTLFYNVPVYECEICKLFNCIPFTRDFCASQNINFNREEPV